MVTEDFDVVLVHAGDRGTKCIPLNIPLACYIVPPEDVDVTVSVFISREDGDS